MQLTTPPNDLKIFYPKAGVPPQPPVVPDPSNPFLKKGFSFGAWDVDKVGLRIIGPAGGGLYLAKVEVHLNKKTDAQGTAVSLGANKVMRESPVLVLSTTAAGPNAEISGCGTGQPQAIAQVYSTKCGWASTWNGAAGGIVPNCTPPACAAGDTKIVSDSCTVHSEWTQLWLLGSCENVCLRGGSSGSYMYESKCPWAFNWNGTVNGSCNPDPCRSGDTLVNKSCSVLAPWWTYNWWVLGNCTNLCASGG